MPLAGTTNEWNGRLHVHACQGVTDLKAQGGTPGWETSTTIPFSPSVGSATAKSNNKNQVITWTMTELGQGADALLDLNISATIKPKITPFSILDLLGNWSLSYSLNGVQQKTSLAGTATVQVMPPVESPM
jgi:hypothetical protein